MMTNFQIEDNCALVLDGRHIDIHNNFDFVGYQYESNNRKLTVSWTKSIGNWVNKDEFSELSLVHSGVDYIDIAFKSTYTDGVNDCCLEDVTFFPSTDRSTNDNLLLQETATEGDDILYVFVNGNYIRVGCDDVNLVAF